MIGRSGLATAGHIFVPTGDFRSRVTDTCRNLPSSHKIVGCQWDLMGLLPVVSTRTVCSGASIDRDIIRAAMSKGRHKRASGNMSFAADQRPVGPKRWRAAPVP